MFTILPRSFFLCSGSADGIAEISAFDQALRLAGVGDTNLVRLSSILPPNTDLVDRFILPPGAFVPCAFAKLCSSTPGERISCAVAVAVPRKKNEAGLIMEYSAVGKSAEEAEEIVRALAAEGMLRRHRPVDKILSTCVAHTVSTAGAVFAGVVLWT